MANMVESQLDQARQRLLDLSMRNWLLNFRPTRRTTIQVVDEIPAEIWKLLIERGKTMSFPAREEHETFNETPDETADDEDAADADGELFALPDVSTSLDGDDGALPQRYTDLFLQTWRGGEVLQKTPPPDAADLPSIPTEPYTCYVDDEHRTTEDYYVAPLAGLAKIINKIVARVFGFSKTGSRIAERVDQSIQAEIDAGRITTDDAGLLKAEDNETDDA